MLHLNPSQPPEPDTQRFDVVHAADLTRPGNDTLRIAREAAVQHAAGLSVGLLHLPFSTGGRIAPDLQRCTRLGDADPVNPNRPVRARLLVLNAAFAGQQMPAALRQVTADRTVILVDRAPQNKLPAERWFSGNVTWAPTDAAVRGALAPLAGDLLDAADWPIPAATADPEVTDRGFERLPVIGTLAEEDGWPDDRDTLARLYPLDGSLDVKLLGPLPKRLTAGWRTTGWDILDSGDISVERFLAKLDIFAFYPARADAAVPLATIAAAMAAGKVVVLPSSLRSRFGSGAIYCEAGEVGETIRRLVLDPVILRVVRRAALRHATVAFSPNAYRTRMEDLLGLAMPEPATPTLFRGRRRPRALFLSANGTGMGHVARQLAIARRASGLDPVFVTMTPTVDIVRAFGFAAEYLPSHGYIGADLAQWDAWYRTELGFLIDAHAAELVVFDGNYATPGLVGAVGSRGNCRLAWIRRGMTGKATIPHLETAGYFDLIIEPGELAEERDTGITAQRRSEVLMVDPIRLLEADDLLPRAEAAAMLGLDPRKPAVLVQLGSGTNRDIIVLANRIIGELSRIPDLQIVMAEWSIASVPLSLWPNVRVMTGFPFSQYFRAFDFSIAAAGYNTFHDVIAFELPTIFVPNTAPGMDDQAARAEFAQDMGMALSLTPERFEELGAMIKVLMTEPAREFIRSNCRSSLIRNGAAAAASALTELAA